MQDQTSRPLLRTTRSLPRRISVFDGQDLKKALLAGAAWLEEHREQINALNVFPVPDGDTGSNMSKTLQAAVKGIENSNETSAGIISAKLAHGALLGARGNSGVILSQILRGLALGLDKKTTFTASDLAVAMHEAQRLAYRAVIKPVEGTILTVVRETAEAAKVSAEHGDDLLGLLQAMVIAARRSVAHTPELLPTLKQAGVVDSGGQGFCTVLEGVWRYVRGESEIDTPQPVIPQPQAEVKKGIVTVEEEFGYEVVFLLSGTQLDVESIRQTIIAMGGVSTVVAGDEKMLKVHTHTDWPGKILDYGVSLGSLLDINIENLQAQSLAYAAESAAEHAQANEQLPSATVAVVAGAGFVEVFKGLGVNAIVSGGQTMNPSTEELLAAVNEVPSQHVIILPNNSNVTLSARQVINLTEKELYIVPTATMPQGIAALIGFNFSADFETNCNVMTAAAQSIQTAEITTAVRSVQLGPLQVREGDYIGIVNGHLAIAEQNMERVIDETLKRMKIEQLEIITLYFGSGINEQQAEELARRIKGQYSQIEIQVVNGGQAHYAYIISAE
ncbi:MAG TPA: DAK2 domain-containing protein [Ktedonobacteraceae bacterium]